MQPLPAAPSPRSYTAPPSGAALSGDALADALFAIPGVTNVLITPAWFTVGKAPTADWKPIKAALVSTIDALAASEAK
jgi:hypothetical protein